MIRIGKFTGRVYDKDVDVSTIGECCMNIDERSPLILEVLSREFPMSCCSECRGCPEYQNS